MRYKCSKCGFSFEGQPNFCPNCGTRMKYQNEDGSLTTAKPTDSVENNQVYSKVVVQKVPVDEGSFGGGFALSFLLGLIGLIIAACVGGSETKRGGIVGFFVQFVIGLTITLFILFYFYR